MNQPFQQPPKEYLISAEDLAHVMEIADEFVATRHGNKIKAYLSRVKPYIPPAPPAPDKE